MRTALLLSFILLVGAALGRAQESPHRLGSPLSGLKKTFEDPGPEVLDRTLENIKKDIKKIEQDQIRRVEQLPETAMKLTKPRKNPFAPQLPVEEKPTATPTTATPTPTKVEPVVQARPAEPPPQFSVSGMVWNSPKPSAIINGQVVSIGESISNWSIESITRDGIKVKFEDRELWIKPPSAINHSVQTGSNFYEN